MKWTSSALLSVNWNFQRQRVFLATGFRTICPVTSHFLNLVDRKNNTENAALCKALQLSQLLLVITYLGTPNDRSALFQRLPFAWPFLGGKRKLWRVLDAEESENAEILQGTAAIASVAKIRWVTSGFHSRHLSQLVKYRIIFFWAFNSFDDLCSFSPMDMANSLDFSWFFYVFLISSDSRDSVSRLCSLPHYAKSTIVKHKTNDYLKPQSQIDLGRFGHVTHCNSVLKGWLEMMAKTMMNRMTHITGPRFDGLRASTIFSTTLAAVGIL